LRFHLDVSVDKHLWNAIRCLNSCDGGRNPFEAHHAPRSLAGLAWLDIIADDRKRALAIIEVGKLGYNSCAIVNAKDSLSPFPERCLANLCCVRRDIVIA
jgi:hypothetical protein